MRLRGLQVLAWVIFTLCVLLSSCSKVGSHLSVQGMQITDDAGKVLIELHAESGVPTLKMRGPDGSERLVAQVLGGGEPQLCLISSTGDTSLKLGLSVTSEDPYIEFLQEAKATVSLYARKKQSGLLIGNANNGVQISLMVVEADAKGEDFLPSLTMARASGRSALLIMVPTQGDAVIDVARQDGSFATFPPGKNEGSKRPFTPR